MQAGSVAADLALECLGSELFGGSSSSMQDQSLAENAEAADDSGEAAGHTEGMLSAVRETRAASGRKARVPNGAIQDKDAWCIPGNASSSPSPSFAHCSQAVLARGLTLEAQCRFLAQACAADAGAMDRLRRVMKGLGLV